MTDIADRADSECEHELAEALRKRKPSGPLACGFCLYCDALLPEGKRWCNAECEADWEYNENRHRQNWSG
jgi:hypothetical protein